MFKFIGVLLCVFPILAYSQPLLTIEQAIEQSINSNLDIKIQRISKENASLETEIASGGFYPQVSAQASILKANNSVNQILSSGSEINRDGAKSTNKAASVNLVYTLFDGLKMFATKERFDHQEKFAEFILLSEIQRVVSEVSLVYFDLIRQRQVISALEEISNIYEDRLKIAEKKFSLGSSPKTEFLQSKVDLNAQKSRLIEERQSEQALKRKLNFLLGRDENIDFIVSPTMTMDYEPVAFSEIGTALANNFLEKAARESVFIAESNVREISAQRYPQLNLISSYQFLENNSQAGFLLQNTTQGFNYGLNVSVPIFQGFRINKSIKQAKLLSTQSFLSLENIQKSNRVTLLNSIEQFQVAREILQLEEENINYARENVSISLEKFRLAQSNILELKEAQRSFEDALTRLITARFRVKNWEIETRRISGDLVRQTGSDL